MSRSSKYPLVSVEEAMEMVLKETAEIQRHTETILLSEATGRILAQKVTAPTPLPPFRASMKDGYAVIAEDGEGEYLVVGNITAGEMPGFSLKSKQVAYITTGSPLPKNADAVVMIEDTEEVEGREDSSLSRSSNPTYVRILKGVKKGADIREIGSDIEKGAVVLSEGEVLGPAEIGLLATVGVSRVKVHAFPTVAVLSSGDELVEASASDVPEGKIRDSNRAMLLSALHALSINVLDLGIAKDEKEDLLQKIKMGLRNADILLSSGGVSMGDLDLIKPILEEKGIVHFGRVLMKPGKPTTFATLRTEKKKRLFFALPGNPVSSFVAYSLFAVPAIRKLSGTDPHLKRIKVKLGHDFKLDPQRPEYHRVSLEWNDKENAYVAMSTGKQASSRLLSLRSAAALALLPQKEGKLESGEWVDAFLLDHFSF